MIDLRPRKIEKRLIIKEASRKAKKLLEQEWISHKCGYSGRWIHRKTSECLSINFERRMFKKDMEFHRNSPYFKAKPNGESWIDVLRWEARKNTEKLNKNYMTISEAQKKIRQGYVITVQ